MSDNPKLLEMNNPQVRPPFNAMLCFQGALLAGLFLLVFGASIPPLYHDWRTFDTFSHGLLVPFISAYLVWQKKAKLLSLPTSSSLWGVAPIFLGVVLAIFGTAVGDSFAERIAMVLCLAGLVWTLFGTAIFRHLAFPLAYLFLMIPLPYVVVKEVAYQLRIIDAALAAPALQALGVPVYRESYYLYLPDITLEVADLCSGISSVFALLALGAAYVYFLPLRPIWKTLAVISTVPFAAFINLLRIILTAALAYYVSPAVLGVLVHQLTGTVTFFIALALFIALVEILQRRLRVAPGLSAVSSPNAPPPASDDRPSRSWLTIGLASAVFIAGFYFAANVKAQVDVRLPVLLNSLPDQFGAFTIKQEPTSGFYREPNADEELSRKYENNFREAIEIYVAFRGRQYGDKRLQSPKLQFPYGWNYVSIEPVLLARKGGEPIKANWMLTQKNQVRVLVLYWYQRPGATVAGEAENRLDQIRRAILERRTDGAVVHLSTPVSDFEQIDKAKNRLADFATELYPELLRVLPR